MSLVAASFPKYVLNVKSFTSCQIVLFMDKRMFLMTGPKNVLLNTCCFCLVSNIAAVLFHVSHFSSVYIYTRTLLLEILGPMIASHFEPPVQLCLKTFRAPVS